MTLRTNNFMGLIATMLLFIGILYLGIKIFQGIFSILAFLAPIIFIATLIINYRVYVNFFKWIIFSIKTNAVMGIIILALCLFALPLTLTYLFFKAINTRKNKTENIEFNTPFTRYREIEDADYLDLTEIKQQKEELNKKYKDLM